MRGIRFTTRPLSYGIWISVKGFHYTKIGFGTGSLIVEHPLPPVSIAKAKSPVKTQLEASNLDQRPLTPGGQRRAWKD